MQFLVLSQGELDKLRLRALDSLEIEKKYSELNYPSACTLSLWIHPQGVFANQVVVVQASTQSSYLCMKLKKHPA